jgi:hypothetical protein
VKPIRPLYERFSEKVDRSAGPDACWPWKGGCKTATTSAGGKRGMIREGGRGSRMLLAHRFALMMKDGVERSPHEEAAHTCDEPLCCNPAHLEWASHRVNMGDYVRKYGRLGVPKTHRRPDLDFVAGGD